MRPDNSYARALLGKQLCGKWHLVRILGSGGMSTVFEGLHRNGRRVAIKVLHPELAASRRVRSRFQREAYVANRVGHPDAVSVVDDDISDDGLVFLVMEYLEGETLGGRVKRTGAPLAQAQVVRAALAVLDVLAVAHRNGVIHRDVKPDNIFLTRHERRIKLLDFGIASLRELSAATSDATGTGATLGTPAFMAPEQARARADEMDVTTDLWGLGATMFTLLTRRFVHEGVNATELLIAAATRPAPSLGSVADGLDRDLVAVVDRALAFEKSARWPDAPSMRTALRALSVQGTEEVFGSDEFLPLAYEQNTQDESNAPASRTTPMFVESAGRRPGPLSRAKGGMRPLYLVTAATLTVATGVWLFRPAPARPSRPLEASREHAPAVDVSPSDSPSLPTTAEPDESPALGATGHPGVPSSTPAAPATVRIGKSDKPRGARANAPSHAGPLPSVAGVQAPAPPPVDPLDRR